MSANVVWRKSSYSGAGSTGSDECVEIADSIPGGVPIRDSKAPTGEALRLPATTWATFISGLDVCSG
ncbi:DUF397 domain-containing protein [Streptomyces griseocarneus]|nr:DUF397 domain-containing protein [Streptomyces griseocarneus]